MTQREAARLIAAGSADAAGSWSTNAQPKRVMLNAVVCAAGSGDSDQQMRQGMIEAAGSL